jgi:hypothetical protein
MGSTVDDGSGVAAATLRVTRSVAAGAAPPPAAEDVLTESAIVDLSRKYDVYCLL